MAICCATVPSETNEETVDADPPTDEERAWFDELVRKNYVEVEFAAHWESMTSAARAAMYWDIKAAEAASDGVSDEAAEGNTPAVAEDAE